RFRARYRGRANRSIPCRSRILCAGRASSSSPCRRRGRSAPAPPPAPASGRFFPPGRQPAKLPLYSSLASLFHSALQIPSGSGDGQCTCFVLTRKAIAKPLVSKCFQPLVLLRFATIGGSVSDPCWIVPRQQN